jgi:hypothetical protein
MADTDDEKRRKALQRLREMRGTAEARPQQTLASSPPQGQPGGGANAGGQGARLRELLARRQAGGGQGARLRELLAKRAAGGGAGQAGGLGGGAGGGRLRELLANRQDGGGGLAGAPGGAAGAAAGQGDRPFLRQLLARRAAGGTAAAAPEPAGAEADEDTSPEATRARLRDRIAKMQARLEELDRAAASKAAAAPADGIEDATVIAETPGKSTSG